MNFEEDPRKPHHAPTPVDGVRTRPSSTPGERRQYLFQWALDQALQHRHATIATARNELLQTFGIAAGTSYIASVLKQATEEARKKAAETRDGVTPITSASAPPPLVATTTEISTPMPALKEIDRLMRALGLRAAEVTDAGLRVQFLDGGKAVLQFEND
jgi:hypothetical protein